MAAWKKRWVTLFFLLQSLIAGSVILIWYFQEADWAKATSSWLVSSPGQVTTVVIASYLVVLGLATIVVANFRPTTAKQMTIFRTGGYKVKIDQTAVENGIRMSLTPFELYNAKARVKMHRNSQKADVVVSGMLSTRSNPLMLKNEISQTIRADLKRKFNIELRKLKVDLTPYSYKQKVEIV